MESYVKIYLRLYLFPFSIGHFFFGLFSFSRSISWAKLNCFNAFFIAGLPYISNPRGNFPSGDIFLILRIISESSRSTLIILFIFATEFILLLILLIFAYSFAILSFNSTFFSYYSPSSSWSEHFFTMV